MQVRCNEGSKFPNLLGPENCPAPISYVAAPDLPAIHEYTAFGKLPNMPVMSVVGGTLWCPVPNSPCEIRIVLIREGRHGLSVIGVVSGACRQHELAHQSLSLRPVGRTAVTCGCSVARSFGT